MSDENDLLRKLSLTFRIEVEEHLRDISSGLLELEKVLPQELERQQIESIFRHAHSLKGAARAVNSRDIEIICQALESVFAVWKRDESRPAAEAFDVLHQALDTMSTLVPTADGMQPPADTGQVNRLIRKIKELGEVEYGSQPIPSKESSAILLSKEIPRQYDPVYQDNLLGLPSTPSNEGFSDGFGALSSTLRRADQTIRLSRDKIDKLLLEAEEMLSAKLAATRHTAELRTLDDDFEQWNKQWTSAQAAVRRLKTSLDSKPGHSHTGASDMEHTVFSNRAMPLLVEFLEWNANYVKILESKFASISRNAARDQYAVSRLVDDLLEDSKRLLMLPFSSLADILPKLVRDLSREQGKGVELVIRGADVELDKRILDEMKDALIHLVRNCIDHGIEQPEFRASQNKPVRATITITAALLNGSKVELVVCDDGQGIDPLQVKRSAIRLGIISEADSQQLSDPQALALVFQSEVSTNPIVTELSGRGLGLAIVREKAEKLGGRVYVESNLHVGSTFRIVLPVTVSTFRGLVVRTGNDTFVVPLSNVECVARISTNQIQTVENRETISFSGRAVSLVRLREVLNIPGGDDSSIARQFVPIFILTLHDERIAFEVSEILQEEEVLVKSLTRPLMRVRNISGASVLVSGKTVLVLNPSDLMRSARKLGSTGILPRNAANAAKTTEGKRILLAEDSITSRMLLKSILEAAGYRVRTAVDGMDALTAIREEEFDLVVSDVEMPRMNGFDLTKHIRADKKLTDKPVVLVTALSSQEDRERGIDAGANAYLIKSSFDQSNLLNVIRRLV